MDRYLPWHYGLLVIYYGYWIIFYYLEDDQVEPYNLENNLGLFQNFFLRFSVYFRNFSCFTTVIFTFFPKISGYFRARVIFELGLFSNSGYFRDYTVYLVAMYTQIFMWKWDTVSESIKTKEIMRLLTRIVIILLMFTFWFIGMYVIV